MHLNSTIAVSYRNAKLMEIQQRISQQRIRHIVDSYRLIGTDNSEADSFDAYINDLLHKYPQGLIELALVETLVQSWLSIPMEKGVAFLIAAHSCIKQWQSASTAITLTPSQFSQITGLDAQLTFSLLTDATNRPTALPTQAALDRQAK